MPNGSALVRTRLQTPSYYPPVWLKGLRPSHWSFLVAFPLRMSCRASCSRRQAYMSTHFDCIKPLNPELQSRKTMKPFQVRRQSTAGDIARKARGWRFKSPWLWTLSAIKALRTLNPKRSTLSPKIQRSPVALKPQVELKNL